MSGIQQNPSDPSGVFFWARSGGGHRTAKEGVKQQKIKETQAQGKTFRVQQDVDITGEKVLSSIKLPFIGGLGELGVKSWDEAQKKGDLKFLERYASWGWIGEIIFYPLVYFRVKWMLQDLNVEPNFVVSTQAFCLNAIMRAMQTVNKEKNWNMHMHVYLTDMPSKKAIHFFPSIRKVTADSELRNLLTLHAPPPLRKPGQTEDDDKKFWEKYCGKINVITNEQFPIREAFLETGILKARLEKPVLDVRIKLNEASEGDLISSGLSPACVHTATSKDITLKIRDKDKLGFLMLGSQPTTQSVLNWLHTFVQSGRAHNSTDGDVQRFLFLYCGVAHTNDARNPLLDAVQEQIKKYKQANKLPPNFNIIPFSNQDADEIALLMARSDVSITRSGGATSMELVQLHQSDLPKRENKLTLIHSEAFQLKTSNHTVIDTEQVASTLSTQMADAMRKRKLLTSDDWKPIKKQMLDMCKSLGYSEKKSKLIVENILRLYTSKDPGAVNLETLFGDLQKSAILQSRATEEQEQMIATEMQRMQQKAKYQSMELPQLRQIAVENVLRKEGIVLWEAGNAKYLQKKIDAHVINPVYAARLLVGSFYA